MPRKGAVSEGIDKDLILEVQTFLLEQSTWGFYVCLRRAGKPWERPPSYSSLRNVAANLPRFIYQGYNYKERRLHSALGYLSPQQFGDQHTRQPVKSAA